MINLLPDKAKTAYLSIYHMRIAVVAAVFLLCIAIMADLLLVPSYILVVAKEQIAEDRLAAATRAGIHSHESLDAIVKDINTKLAVFPSKPDLFSFPIDGIDNIVSKRLSGVYIKEFRYSRQLGGAHQISISGVATSREVLQSFVKTLAADTKYQGVALPLSNFIYGSNIPFNLAFTATVK